MAWAVVLPTIQELWRNYDNDEKITKNGGWDYELSTSNLGIRTETILYMYVDGGTIGLSVMQRLFTLCQGSRRLNLICSPCFGWAQGSAKTLQTCKLHCHIFPKWCPHDSIIQKKCSLLPWSEICSIKATLVLTASPKRGL